MLAYDVHHLLQRGKRLVASSVTSLAATMTGRIVVCLNYRWVVEQIFREGVHRPRMAEAGALQAPGIAAMRQVRERGSISGDI